MNSFRKLNRSIHDETLTGWLVATDRPTGWRSSANSPPTGTTPRRRPSEIPFTVRTRDSLSLKLPFHHQRILRPLLVVAFVLPR